MLNATYVGPTDQPQKYDRMEYRATLGSVLPHAPNDRQEINCNQEKHDVQLPDPHHQAGLALALAISLGGTALAHGSMKPRHGGQVAISGETVVELVRRPKGVSVYVTDEDKPLRAPA